MRSLLAIAALAFVSGCSSQLAQLKAASFERDDFSTALAREYRDYADSEAEQHRLLEAERFAEKGIAALSGAPVLPDEAPPTPRLQKARAELMALLTEDNKAYDPASMARAQVLYDCLLSEEKRGHIEESNACANEFRAVIDRLNEEL